MFEPLEKDQTNIFSLTLRIVYLLLAIAVDLGVLYVTIFTGSTRDEMFSRGVTGMLLLLVSLVLSAPVFPYVVWKLIRYERPIFWGIALLIAAVPVLLFLAVVISGL